MMKKCENMRKNDKNSLKNDKNMQKLTNNMQILKFSLIFYQNISPGRLRANFGHQKPLNFKIDLF